MEHARCHIHKPEHRVLHKVKELREVSVSHGAWELNSNTRKLGALLKAECWEAVMSKHAAGCLCWWMCWNKLSQPSLVRDVNIGVVVLGLAFDHRYLTLCRSKHLGLIVAQFYFEVLTNIHIRKLFTVKVIKWKGSSLVAPVHIVSEESADKTNLGFIHAFVAAISVIIVSELGDKTFFIAAIMAMRYNRLTVLAGAMLALGLMTCLSVLFGYATTVIPRVYTYYVSTALFAIFGIRMLREGLKMSPDEGQEELEEVQAEIKKKDEELQRTKLLNGPGDVESGPGTTIPQKKWLHFISPIFVQAFTLTFLAEWGDRSQLTTIVLAAREDPYGVAVGGTVGHCLCTGLAVIGGRMIAQKISVRTVTIIGGIVFLAFAFSALFISPDSGF
ncbi:hypothetical protein DV515_00002787 [Chloebia gouldiae]|uniref:GDT1 family protein n=8 Tax=Telluraves TaxID=3073808 RepID=A0A3L8SUP9_CHLGU|nr:hypothetical protein DV515_00002787 [Chloebia gouldiae]